MTVVYWVVLFGSRVWAGVLVYSRVSCDFILPLRVSRFCDIVIAPEIEYVVY